MRSLLATLAVNFRPELGGVDAVQIRACGFTNWTDLP